LRPPEEVPLEALIREARRRARRRRCLYAAGVGLLALLTVVLTTAPGRPDGSRDLSAASAADPGLGAGTASRLAFESTGVGHGVLWVMNPDGTERHVLTRDTAGTGVAWSPDGRMLAFVGVQVGLGDVYVVNADGTGMRRLTQGHDGLMAFEPAWSPDGRRIAFARYPPNPLRSGKFGIFVVDVAGGEERLLARHAFQYAGHVWSPDGRQVVFDTRTETGASGVFVVNADGTGLRNLTRAWGLDSFPVWSPDGRRIAFAGGPPGRRTLSVMNADGTGPATVRRRAGALDGVPAWSPDGRQLAFALLRAGVPEIHVVNIDGSGERRLATRATRPIWSPDGRKIAFHGWLYGATDISVMNADGSGRRTLTHPRGYDVDLAWSPGERK